MTHVLLAAKDPAKDFSRGNSFCYAVQGCERTRRKKIDVKSADFLHQFQRLFADSLRASELSGDVDIHAVEFQLHSIAIPTAVENAVTSPPADSVPDSSEPVVASISESIAIDEPSSSAHLSPVLNLPAVTQRVDAASERLFIAIPAASKADVVDMFVSDNGSTLLIRLTCGDDGHISLIRTVDAESLTAKYSQRLKRFNLSAAIK